MSIYSQYRSTVHFCRFVERHISEAPISIVQVSAREGKDLAYIVREFPEASVVGMEASSERAAIARDYCESREIGPVSIVENDWRMLNDRFSKKFDGVMSLYDLSEVPSIEAGMERLCSLAKEWIAASVLLWQGTHDFIILACPVPVEPGSNPDGAVGVHYNIYSLQTLSESFRRNGFGDFSAEPFEIDVDIQRPEVPRLGTYTERTCDGRRLQVSGPLLMPWWFVFARRSEVPPLKGTDIGTGA